MSIRAKRMVLILYKLTQSAEVSWSGLFGASLSIAGAMISSLERIRVGKAKNSVQRVEMRYCRPPRSFYFKRLSGRLQEVMQTLSLEKTGKYTQLFCSWNHVWFIENRFLRSCGSTNCWTSDLFSLTVRTWWMWMSESQFFCLTTIKTK